MKNKMIIYQVFTRLFGNDKTACIPHGNKTENGCGHFADFTQKALTEIQKLGATHIWYTGVIAHATQTDYTSYGIPSDHPAIVKGKAGSPYAIKDYYDVDPDLATKPEKRMKEFQNLIYRTHDAGLKVIIDFVPNHVARQYQSASRPEGVKPILLSPKQLLLHSRTPVSTRLRSARQCTGPIRRVSGQSYRQ